MTKLSVNINKIALLRNSRGRDFPNVVEFAKKFIDLGVAGITVHPRQDERHITVQDAYDLAEFLQNFPDIEYNIEGYPSTSFIQIIRETKPTQCTLVPDGTNQITSDHGWDLGKHQQKISKLATELRTYGVRSAVFLDPSMQQVKLAAQTGIDRIELYTEEFASAYGSSQQQEVMEKYTQASALAQKLGLGVNAGHDLDLDNLAAFLQIDNILEVSIGHALTIESIELGMSTVVQKYLNICKTL